MLGQPRWGAVRVLAACTSEFHISFLVEICGPLCPLSDSAESPASFGSATSAAGAPHGIAQGEVDKGAAGLGELRKLIHNSNSYGWHRSRRVGC